MSGNAPHTLLRTRSVADDDPSGAGCRPCVAAVEVTVGSKTAVKNAVGRLVAVNAATGGHVTISVTDGVASAALPAGRGVVAAVQSAK